MTDATGSKIQDISNSIKSVSHLNHTISGLASSQNKAVDQINIQINSMTSVLKEAEERIERNTCLADILDTMSIEFDDIQRKFRF